MEKSREQNRNQQNQQQQQNRGNLDQQRNRLSSSEGLNQDVSSSRSETPDIGRNRSSDTSDRSANLSTKRNVSGSEYDGQLSEE